MNIAREKEIKLDLAKFAGPNATLAILALAADVALYASGVGVAVLATPIWLKIAGVLVAGTATSTLFILGHDAAHKSLARSELLNSALGRLAFLPCLHNRTLWTIQHNQLHHQSTNVKGQNSFSPLSVEEYVAFSTWQRLVERFYRSVFGFGAYYLVERWWKDKFFPRADTPVSKRGAAWRDVVLIVVWASVLCIGLVGIAVKAGQPMPMTAVLWGFILPFLVWNSLMGTTAYLQHTNRHIPWFRSRVIAVATKSQAELAAVVCFPRWYDVLSHNIMKHSAHHLNPRIPWFRLSAAQRRLTELLGPEVVVEKMSLRYLRDLTKNCQLYDYDGQRWLNFAGNPTTLPESPLRPSNLSEETERKFSLFRTGANGVES
jgi:acyl-lipid omega-6 desaturase (Delta-12 desaturase)